MAMTYYTTSVIQSIQVMYHMVSDQYYYLTTEGFYNLIQQSQIRPVADSVVKMPSKYPIIVRKNRKDIYLINTM